MNLPRAGCQEGAAGRTWPCSWCTFWGGVLWRQGEEGPAERTLSEALGSDFLPPHPAPSQATSALKDSTTEVCFPELKIDLHPTPPSDLPRPLLPIPASRVGSRPRPSWLAPVWLPAASPEQEGFRAWGRLHSSPESALHFLLCLKVRLFLNKYRPATLGPGTVAGWTGGHSLGWPVALGVVPGQGGRKPRQQREAAHMGRRTPLPTASGSATHPRLPGLRWGPGSELPRHSRRRPPLPARRTGAGSVEAGALVESAPASLSVNGPPEY